MDKRKIISYLLIANLTILLIAMISKFEIVAVFIQVLINVVILPVVFSVFLFYLLQPINATFVKKKMKKGKAATLTIIIFLFIMFGFFRYFGDYLIKEFLIIKDMIIRVVEDKGIIDKIRGNLNGNIISEDYYNIFVSQVQNHIGDIVSNVRGLFSKSMQLFANTVLVILIVFYLLREGEKLSDLIITKTPNKYKVAICKTLEQGNLVLASYIKAQARVAFSLALMVYIGYKIIGMTSASLLATITFVLAFIPFIGFFISMIIPYIIAITIGIEMVIKLTILFIIAQTLKGRIIVPLIMGNAVDIHPITDIFLVVGAATLIGPIGAFVVVPIYALIKVFYSNFKPYIKK